MNYFKKKKLICFRFRFFTMASSGKSIPIIKNRSKSASSSSRRNGSHVWRYCAKVDGNTICKVSNCNKTWTEKTGTSTITSHLANFHSITTKDEEMRVDKENENSGNETQSVLQRKSSKDAKHCDSKQKLLN